MQINFMKQLSDPKCDYKSNLALFLVVVVFVLFSFHIWTVVTGIMRETHWLTNMESVWSKTRSIQFRTFFQEKEELVRRFKFVSSMLMSLLAPWSGFPGTFQGNM